MMKLGRSVGALLLITVLSACNVEVPAIDSAKVAQYESGKPQKTWELNRSEIAALSQWFQRHQDGWSPTFTTYAPGLNVVLGNAKRPVGGLNILGNRLVVNVERGQYIRELSPEEISSLRTLVRADG